MQLPCIIAERAIYHLVMDGWSFGLKFLADMPTDWELKFNLHKHSFYFFIYLKSGTSYHHWDDKPSISSQIWMKITFFFFHFLLLISQILYWQNFGCQFAKIAYRPCNLHELLSCIDSNECFYALLNISLFWDTRFYHLSDDMIIKSYFIRSTNMLMT